MPTITDRFPRALVPTTPRMHDGDIPEASDDVSRAQQLLFRNRFGPKDAEDGGGEFYHQDEPQHRDDAGWFGRESGEAASQARYWLGYPKGGQQGWARRKFDQLLADRLRGDKKLPPHYRARRRRRLKRAQESLGSKALAWSRQHPESEHPAGSNRCPTTAWYGFVGAWCLMRVTRAYVSVGSKVFRRGIKWAYNPTMYHAVKGGIDGAIFVPLSKARPGDVVQFDWNDGTEPPDHAALFIRRDGSTVVTYDGNWDSRAGEQRHPAGAVMAVIRVFE